MNNIPVTFEFEGKEYHGFLSPVSGSGSSSNFHLSIDDYHWGQLFYTEKGWRFYGSKPGMSAKAEEFGYVVIAWLDGQG